MLHTDNPRCIVLTTSKREAVNAYTSDMAKLEGKRIYTLMTVVEETK